MIRKGHVGTLQAFTADYWNAAGAGKVVTNMEAAWGPGDTPEASRTRAPASGGSRICPSGKPAARCAAGTGEAAAAS
ncbi:hypothetical protein ACFSC4_06545 [Deinococcus malanensis]|uniref:hypothetical protein n=1 Tax=Deinococcus malanensis TaxID=1706855 RepID=UPI0036388E56